MQEKFEYSEYQKKIFDFVANGVGNAVVDAKAGSGKTTTAIKSLDFIPKNKKVLFVAFNKDIVKSLVNKLHNYDNAHASTFNSLGFSILKECIGRDIEVMDYKYKNFINSNINELSGGVYGGLGAFDKKEYLNNIIKLTDLSRLNCAQSKNEILKIAEKYGIVLEGTEPVTTEDILKWGQEEYRVIDFIDMLWLPYELHLTPHINKYDWIIIDEAQDSSPIEQELIKKCKRKGTRFMAIGDTSQAINAWCGADEDAFYNYSKEDNTIHLPLPISYRCPKKIIELAQEFEPNIQAKPDAKEGEVLHDVSPFIAKEGDMVLCRNTLPLTKLYTLYLKKNIKCFIRGTDIGSGLISLINSTQSNQVNASLLNDGVISRLYKTLFKSLQRIQNNYNISIEDAIGTKEFSHLYDSIKTIEILSEGISEANTLKEKINKIFKDDEHESGICLTTVHKAKGLEADNVYIICPSLMPSTLATQEWEITQEENIQYVAITRAKSRLGFVSETLFPPMKGCTDAESVLLELQLKATYIETIYGTNPLTGEKLPNSNGKTVTLIKKEKQSIKGQPQKTKIGANKFKKFCK